MSCQHNSLTGCSDCQAKATYAELGRVRDELHRTQQTLGLIAYAGAHLRPDEALRNLIANTLKGSDDVDLQPIKEAMEKATPGPWERDDTTNIDGRAWTYLYAGREPIGSISVNPWDVDLIANAPTWLAQLVAEVERLRGLVERIRDSADAVIGSDVASLDPATISFWCADALAPAEVQVDA